MISRSACIFAPMDIALSEKETVVVEKIARAAQAQNMPAFLVGGFVRDKLLFRTTKDLDVVCIGDGIALAHAVANEFSPAPHVSFFKNFGTAHIRIPGSTEGEFLDVEFVGARKESYQQNSRNPEVAPGTLEDDQKRRDFTINALAISLNKADYGTLLDPFDGRGDLERCLIRTPLDPQTTFSDDPLRMMRAIRFSTQLGFDISPETFDAITAMADRLPIISGERIIDELNKIVLAPKPSIGFDQLYRTGLLAKFFPQMVALAGAEYIDGKGHKDNFYHTIQVLDNVADQTKDLWIRWAAILHDIAKPATKRFEAGHGWTFHGHEVVGGRMVPKIFTQLKLPQQENMRLVRKLVELHLRPISLTKENITDSAIRRLLFDAGEDLESLFMLCRADITSKNETKVRRYLANFEMVMQRCAEVESSDQIRNWQPPITGEMIMQVFGLSPSREVGIIKTAIREAILDGIIPNDYESAYAYMLEQAQGLGLDPEQETSMPEPDAS
jgi:putative nucleotidyltransferase with HDIG domain